MMNGYQTAGLAILAVYYGAYFIKLFGQKRKGIKTTQFGMGVKAKRTVITERILQVVSVLTVIAEALSVGYNAGNMLLKEIRIFGLLMAVLGTAVFIVAMFTMQESWRAGIPESKDTKLVTRGIYKVSRNPAFLGFDLVYIGLGIAFFNIWMCVISVVGIIMMHLQILEEEKFLQEIFGKEYIGYRESVERYVGFCHRKK